MTVFVREAHDRKAAGLAIAAYLCTRTVTVLLR